MDSGFALAMALALAFAVTNGLHDASNAIAALVTTRGARPLQAALLAAVFDLLGPLLLGAAVADTVGGIVTVPGSTGIVVIAAGLAAAVTWNLVTWATRIARKLRARARRRPGRRRSHGRRRERDQLGRPRRVASGRCPRNAGRARDLAAAGDRRRLRGAAEPAPGAPARNTTLARTGAGRHLGDVGDARLRTRLERRPEVGGRDRWVLGADGRANHPRLPPWAAVACATALTAGTVLGGWRIVATIGRRIVRCTRSTASPCRERPRP